MVGLHRGPGPAGAYCKSLADLRDRLRDELRSSLGDPRGRSRCRRAPGTPPAAPDHESHSQPAPASPTSPSTTSKQVVGRADRQRNAPRVPYDAPLQPASRLPPTFSRADQPGAEEHAHGGPPLARLTPAGGLTTARRGRRPRGQHDRSPGRFRRRRRPATTHGRICMNIMIWCRSQADQVVLRIDAVALVAPAADAGRPATPCASPLTSSVGPFIATSNTLSDLARLLARAATSRSASAGFVNSHSHSSISQQAR